MSIVRVGLSETKKFAEGFEAIFGKTKAAAKKKTSASTKGTGAKKKKATKKKA